jgi:hypothetical protein
MPLEGGIESAAYKKLVNYALSVVLSGHSGVRAFLPAFLLSAISLAWPDVVDLAPSMEWVRHPATASLAGILSLAEMIAEVRW